MKNDRPTGFTFIEVLIVVVILGVLAATLIPHFRVSAEEDQLSQVKFDLLAIQSQINLYKSQHGDQAPGDLAVLTKKTDAAGQVGTSPAHCFGPYLMEIPQSPLHGNNLVVQGDGSGVAGSGEAWQYDPLEGQVWINHPDFVPPREVETSLDP